MVQYIPRQQSLIEKLTPIAEDIGMSLGQRLGKNVSDQKRNEALKGMLGEDVSNLPPEFQQMAFQYALMGQLEKQKAGKALNPLQEAQKNLAEEKIRALQGQQDLSNRTFGGQTSQISPETGETTQEITSPLDLSTIPEEQLRQGAAFAGQQGKMGILGNMYKGELEKRSEEKKGRSDKEKQYFKLNEPKIMQLADTSNKLQQEEARYNRLGELFNDPSKFPSAFTAALFSKDGQINDLVYSQLTPEAQEAIKLIIDSTSNIKDTYGARVTNFDLQTYLKKLPSLLNTPEGKMRVLRDLQIMNKLNQLHAQGIMDVFDEAGGTDKIPYSTAEKLYKKKYGALERQYISQFVNPDKGIFNELPDPQEYLGRKIKNPETGEIFISDGNEWKPFKG